MRTLWPSLVALAQSSWILLSNTLGGRIASYCLFHQHLNLSLSGFKITIYPRCARLFMIRLFHPNIMNFGLICPILATTFLSFGFSWWYEWNSLFFWSHWRPFFPNLCLYLSKCYRVVWIHGFGYNGWCYDVVQDYFECVSYPKETRQKFSLSWLAYSFSHALFELLPSSSLDHNPLFISCLKSCSIKYKAFHF